LVGRNSLVVPTNIIMYYLCIKQKNCDTDGVI
jgi:hypothetical protein